MPDWMVNLVAQAPIVIVFVWFVLEMRKRDQASLEKRDELYQDAQSKRDELLERAQNRRDELWRDFLREQRNAYNGALSRLAEEIKGISKEVNSIASLLASHDTRATQAVSDLLQEIKKEKT